jgi:hypothetical protein
MTDDWQFWDGKSKFPGICERCGQVVDKDVFYLGRRKMHAACYAEYKKQARVVPDQAELPEPTANASKTLSNAPSSVPANENESKYQELDTRTLKALEQIGAEISEVARAIKAQTDALVAWDIKKRDEEAK